MEIYDPNAKVLNGMTASLGAETYEKRTYDISTATYAVFS